MAAQEDGGTEFSGGGFEDVEVTPEGYAVAGTAEPVDGSLDGYLLNIDEEGNTRWQRLYGGSGTDYFTDVLRTDDGYLLAGARDAPNRHVKGDAWLVRTTRDGSTEWSDVYAGDSRSRFNTVQELSDGYLAMGSSNSDGGVIVKVDRDGERVWNKSRGTVIAASHELPHGFLIAGAKIEGGSLTPWLASITATAEVEWEKTYSAGRNRFSTILPVDDGYLLGTQSGSVVKVGSDGGQEWAEQLPIEYVYDIEEIGDRYAVGGGIPATATRATSVVEITGDGEVVHERRFGFSVTEVVDVEGPEYAIVAQGVDRDVLALVDASEPPDAEQGSGEAGGTPDSTGTEGDGGDAPLGTPLQVSLHALVVLSVLGVLALASRVRS